jgi:competence protein ComEA
MLENGGAVKTGRISGTKSISLGVPIGINTAEARDLAALPGIGDKLVERIIDYRKNSGGFKSLDELRSVEGIGDKKLEALRSKASLD